MCIADAYCAQPSLPKVPYSAATGSLSRPRQLDGLPLDRPLAAFGTDRG
jgi:hypothetical protein